MAAVSQRQDNSEHAASGSRRENELFMPKQMLDQRCDIILLVEDGKEFKAHKQVLSEASPFFEKLLNSDMKESREGIVCLEMFSESAMRNTLQFIYTGDVQILAEDNARDLVVSADYFFLPTLKPLAEAALVEMLNTSNCLSAYYFSQRYQCERLLAKSEKYILANFIAVYEMNREEVLNMSNKEMEMWLSSDEINVSAEEDVFKIILAWIDHDRNKRQQYFVELFRHVRLHFASRDFLSSDILINDLVKDNEICLNRVVGAINLIDSQNYSMLSISPRKSLETSAIVVTSAVTKDVARSFDRSTHWELSGQSILCYFPGVGRWCKLGEMPREYSGRGQFIFCRGRLYSINLGSAFLKKFKNMLCEDMIWPLMYRTLACYNPYSNCWTRLPYKDSRLDWVLREIFVRNGSEMYALISHMEAVEYKRQRWYGEPFPASRGFFPREGEPDNYRRKCVSSITKYKVEANLWEDVTSFDHLDRKEDFCLVAKDDFVYFIGGVERRGKVVSKSFTDVYRYDLCKNKWNKVADIQESKTFLSGAACNGRIFITGKVELGTHETCQCEVYNETTNEWQFIANFSIKAAANPKLLSVDEKLFALGSWMRNEGGSPPDTRVECYDPDKNEWILETEIPIRTRSNTTRAVSCCSTRIFKGFLSDHQMKSYNLWSFVPAAWSAEASESKCVIM